MKQEISSFMNKNLCLEALEFDQYTIRYSHLSKFIIFILFNILLYSNFISKHLCFLNISNNILKPQHSYYSG